MPRRDTKVNTPHLPLPLANKVDQLAAHLERPCAPVAREVLAPSVAHETDLTRLTREALANVHASQVIDHQSVLAWADSLGTDKPLQAPRP